MQRLFKKYSLLLWLGLLLSAGFAATSALTFMMSRDLLLQQSATTTLPALGDSLHAEVAAAIARALADSSGMAGDNVLRDWLGGEEQDYAALAAHLKSMPNQSNVISRFVVADSAQKYVDSLGTVRNLNAENGRDAGLERMRTSTRAYEVLLESDPVGDAPVTMMIASRVLDREHQFVGSTGITFALDGLARLMTQYVGDGSRAIYFVDRQGNVVLSDSTARRVGNVHQQEGISQIASELLSEVHGERQGKVNLSYDKKDGRVLVSARAIPELGWTLIIEQNAQPATLAAWPLAYVSAVAGIVVTILALLIAGMSIARHQRRLRLLAGKDSMTGLLNRQSFTSTFEQARLEMQRLKLPMSFILFDIDFLKKINESHGHATGDKIITDIARLSRRSVRGSDVLCRWGGEQFALLVKRCELEQAYKIAEQLRLNVQNYPFELKNQDASVTISLGVAEWTENETIEELFGRVDEAVFLAKSEGRNRAEISYYVSA